MSSSLVTESTHVATYSCCTDVLSLCFLVILVIQVTNFSSFEDNDRKNNVAWDLSVPPGLISAQSRANFKVRYIFKVRLGCPGSHPAES